MLLILIRLVWRFYNTSPSNRKLPKIHRIFSTIIHNFLYFLVIITTIQGTLMSQAGGFDVKLLGLISIPKFIPTNFEQYPTFVKFHYQSFLLQL